MVAERWDAGRTPAHADGVGDICSPPQKSIICITSDRKASDSICVHVLLEQ